MAYFLLGHFVSWGVLSYGAFCLMGNIVSLGISSYMAYCLMWVFFPMGRHVLCDLWAHCLMGHFVLWGNSSHGCVVYLAYRLWGMQSVEAYCLWAYCLLGHIVLGRLGIGSLSKSSDHQYMEDTLQLKTPFCCFVPVCGNPLSYVPQFC